MKTIGTMSGAALEHDARAAQVPHPSTRGLGNAVYLRFHRV